MRSFWHRDRVPALLDRRRAGQRVRALVREVSTLRRALAVANSEKARAERILADTALDIRNGVPLVRHITVCQQLHEAETRIQHLTARARAHASA